MAFTKEKRDHILKVVDENIIKFSKIVLSHHVEDKTPEFHKEVFDLLTDESVQKKAVIAPREHAKSTIANLIFLLHRVLFKREKFVVVVSESYGQSVLFLDAVKRELEENEMIHALFGNLRSDKWAEGDIVTSTGIRIMCKGSGQRMRGLKYLWSRPTLIILDDFESESNTETQEQRDKLFRWINAAVLPSLDKNGRIVLIGTIVHNDSYLNHIRKLGESSGWRVLYYQAELPNGKSLWEERMPYEKLMQRKSEYASQGLLDLYYMEYMNIASAPEGRPFQSEMIQYHNGVLSIDNGEFFIRLENDYFPVNVYIGVDPSLGKARGDFTGIVVTAFDDKGRAYILEVHNIKVSPDVLLDKIFEFNDKYHRKAVFIIETTAYQESLIHFARVKMRETGNFVPIREVKPRTQKSQRILSMQPHFSSKRVFVRRHFTELISQLLEYPKSSHDDILDALWNTFAFATNASPRQKQGKGRRKLTIKKYNWAAI